jgi:hypothetical protein
VKGQRILGDLKLAVHIRASDARTRLEISSRLRVDKSFGLLENDHRLRPEYSHCATEVKQQGQTMNLLVSPSKSLKRSNAVEVC